MNEFKFKQVKTVNVYECELSTLIDVDIFEKFIQTGKCRYVDLGEYLNTTFSNDLIFETVYVNNLDHTLTFEINTIHDNPDFIEAVECAVLDFYKLAEKQVEYD